MKHRQRIAVTSITNYSMAIKILFSDIWYVFFLKFVLVFLFFVHSSFLLGIFRHFIKIFFIFILNQKKTTKYKTQKAKTRNLSSWNTLKKSAHVKNSLRFLFTTIPIVSVLEADLRFFFWNLFHWWGLLRYDVNKICIIIF